MLQFPSASSKDNSGYFVMSPIRFIVSDGRNKTIKRAAHITKHDSTIILPTPNSGLVLNESGKWDEIEGFQHAASLEGTKQAATGAIAKKVVDSLGGVAKYFTKGEFINDYASLAYQGSNFREFGYNWVLIPNSKDEATEIMNIIKTIRFYSLPNYNSTNEKGMVKYPWMWDVNPSLAGKLDVELKDCVVTNFTVNYSPEGVLKTYSSGHPVSVTMDISFKELYKATDGDVLGLPRGVSKAWKGNK